MATPTIASGEPSLRQPASTVTGPNVGVPEQSLMAEPVFQRRDAKATEPCTESPMSSASSDEARQQFPSVTTDRYALAFDIDGVLVRGGKAIPEAKEALLRLNGENEYGIKV